MTSKSQLKRFTAQRAYRKVTWICDRCAINAGARYYGLAHVSTYHEDECGVCHEFKSVTEPRDFIWPEVEKP